jgi:hypothetical protein
MPIHALPARSNSTHAKNRTQRQHVHRATAANLRTQHGANGGRVNQHAANRYRSHRHAVPPVNVPTACAFISISGKHRYMLTACS